MSHKYRSGIFLFLLLILATGMRLYHLEYKSLSIDETIGTYYSREPVKRILIMTINDVHPPLFYIVHHFWLQAFGTTEWAIRSLSVLFALFSLLVLYFLARRLFSALTALLAALLLALSPWHIWISQNGRSNSMLVFLILLSTFFLFKLLQSPKRRWFLLYGITTLASLLTHYFAFMIWAAQIIFIRLNVPSYRKLTSSWRQTNLAVSLGYFVWLPFMISQYMTKTRPMYKTFSFRFIKNLFHYLNPYAAVSGSLLFYAGVCGLLILFLFGFYHTRQHVLELTVAQDPGLSNSVRRRLMLGFGLVILVNLLGALYFNVSRTLPILLKHLVQNSPNIFANSLKPYHLEQLHSLQICFAAAACIAMVALATIWWMGRLENLQPKQFLANHHPISMQSFFLLVLFLPPLLAGILSLKSPYLLLRNMVIVLPFYIMILAHGLMHLHRWPRLLSITAMVLLSLFSFLHYEDWYKKDDWRSAARVLRNNRRPEEVVLLDHLFGKKPLYYYGVESHQPLRRSELAGFMDQLKGDLWVLRSYKNDWCVVDSANKYFSLVGEWTFPGSTNPDDLFPIEGQLKLFHYHKKAQEFLAHKQGSIPPINRLFGKSGSAPGASPGSGDREPHKILF